MRDKYVGPAYATIASSTTAQTSAAVALSRLKRSGFTCRYAQAAASAIRNPGANLMRSTVGLVSFRDANERLRSSTDCGELPDPSRKAVAQEVEVELVAQRSARRAGQNHCERVETSLRHQS